MYELLFYSDATTIFRGNTLVSKMMDEAMRLSGASYLRSVLRPTLAAVLAEKRPCEIDPARVKPSAAIATNLINLRDYVERVSNSNYSRTTYKLHASHVNFIYLALCVEGCSYIYLW